MTISDMTDYDIFSWQKVHYNLLRKTYSQSWVVVIVELFPLKYFVMCWQQKKVCVGKFDASLG